MLTSSCVSAKNCHDKGTCYNAGRPAGGRPLRRTGPARRLWPAAAKRADRAASGSAGAPGTAGRAPATDGQPHPSWWRTYRHHVRHASASVACFSGLQEAPAPGSTDTALRLLPRGRQAFIMQRRDGMLHHMIARLCGCAPSPCNVVKVFFHYPQVQLDRLECQPVHERTGHRDQTLPSPRPAPGLLSDCSVTRTQHRGGRGYEAAWRELFFPSERQAKFLEMI